MIYVRWKSTKESYNRGEKIFHFIFSLAGMDIGCYLLAIERCCCKHPHAVVDVEMLRCSDDVEWQWQWNRHCVMLSCMSFQYKLL